MTVPLNAAAAAEAITKEQACPVHGCPCHRAAAQGHGDTHCLGPGHTDQQPSMGVWIDAEGRLAYTDRSGRCTHAQLTEAIKARDLWPYENRRNGHSSNGFVIDATFDYQKADGDLLFQVVKLIPKDFRQRRPDPAGKDGWTWNLKGVTRVPYRLPQLLAAKPGSIIYTSEGEKDTDRLEALGLIATTNAGGAGKWLTSYNPYFRGHHVAILEDNDEAGHKHAQLVARNLADVAASVRVISLPGLPEHGDVSDWLDAGGTADALEELRQQTPLWEPTEADEDQPPPEEPAEPRTLAEVEAIFQRWLYMDDLTPLHAMLGALAANYAPGDPCWLMLVGGSSSGKTEILQSANGLSNVHVASTFTSEAALLSGTSKKDKDKNATGGLLRAVGPFGICMLKDATSIIAMHREERGRLLAAFREIFDGSWHRDVGVDGGRRLSWEGKLGMIAGVTSAIDSAHSVTSTLGERFMYLRLPPIDRQQQARQALRNVGREAEMRHELREAVRGLFAGLDLTAEPVQPSEEERERIIALASLAALCRSGVDRDGRSHAIELIHDAEGPARLAGSLLRLYGGLRTIGLDPAAAWAVVYKAGLDSMPKIRRTIFETLRSSSGWIATPTLASLAGYPTETARRAAEDLMVHGVVVRTPGAGKKPDVWRLSDLARELLALCAPETSEYTVYEDEATDAGEEYEEEKDTPNPAYSDVSGAQELRWSEVDQDDAGGERTTHCWKCKVELSTAGNDVCSSCGWLRCDCGACEEGCAGNEEDSVDDPGIAAATFALAERLAFPEVALRRGLDVGGSANTWRTWIDGADLGLLRHAHGILSAMLRARSTA